jgi:hypothetical protein
MRYRALPDGCYQGGLADARFAAEQEQHATARQRLGEQTVGTLQLSLSANQRNGRRRGLHRQVIVTRFLAY